jgi:hypothetical protein
VQQGDMPSSPIDAHGKHVVIIGGGDTGADCLGTAIRQGAASITQLEIMPMPPVVRASNNPWPQWSLIYRTSSAHEEGGERVFSVNTERFIDDGNGNVKALVLNEVRMRCRWWMESLKTFLAPRVKFQQILCFLHWVLLVQTREIGLSDWVSILMLAATSRVLMITERMFLEFLLQETWVAVKA